MRRILSVLVALMLGLAMTASVAPKANAVVEYCNIRWGSLAEGGLPLDDLSAAPLTAVRAGSHMCFDRVVFDVVGDAGDYSVRYVSTVHAPGSGDPVAVRGGARLAIVLGNPAHNSSGQATLNLSNPGEMANVSGFHTFRQLRYAGSFEGQTTFALGVRARLPFRVFTLEGPGSGTRVVIDVARFW